MPYYTISTANLRAGDSWSSAPASTLSSTSSTPTSLPSHQSWPQVTPTTTTSFTSNETATRRHPHHYHCCRQRVFPGSPPADTGSCAGVDCPNDGNPDDQGFDFNTSVDVAATDVGVYNFVTGVATVSGGTGCTAQPTTTVLRVHCSGAGSIGQKLSVLPSVIPMARILRLPQQPAPPIPRPRPTPTQS